MNTKLSVRVLVGLMGAMLLGNSSCDRGAGPAELDRDGVSFNLVVDAMQEKPDGQLWANVSIVNASAFSVLIRMPPWDHPLDYDTKLSEEAEEAIAQSGRWGYCLDQPLGFPIGRGNEYVFLSGSSEDFSPPTGSYTAGIPLVTRKQLPELRRIQSEIAKPLTLKVTVYVEYLVSCEAVGHGKAASLAGGLYKSVELTTLVNIGEVAKGSVGSEEVIRDR